ncbi:hypothetical protein QTI33_32020 [Variovorax sp. J22P271]|uniref:hypothetical protein n=1 Tax=Variovorax davisae TaxID=3053515 RepID=UPI002575D2DB|nr:hypothetical protein [Variovorax sp. J22P271]MDM0036800.1 hypothetical protein [Variovorax sp. J22P271]
MTHHSQLSKELRDRIMRAVADREGGSFDRLFALLMAKRLDIDEPFAPRVVEDVFEEARRLVKASPSPRDALDVRDLYESLMPHVRVLREQTGDDRYSEIFRLVYRP